MRTAAQGTPIQAFFNVRIAITISVCRVISTIIRIKVLFFSPFIRHTIVVTIHSWCTSNESRPTIVRGRIVPLAEKRQLSALSLAVFYFLGDAIETIGNVALRLDSSRRTYRAALLTISPQNTQVAFLYSML